MSAYHLYDFIVAQVLMGAPAPVMITKGKVSPPFVKVNDNVQVFSSVACVAAEL